MIDASSHENIYRTVVDPSMTTIPAWLNDAYGQMNAGIADERNRYGETIQYMHLMLSKAAISATARTALHRAPAHQERNAIILGAGGCLDIPLEEIVSDFTATTLVDVETDYTEEALSSLPAHLLGKVTILNCDVTGNIGALSAIIEQSSHHAEYAQFIRQASKAVVQQTIAPPHKLFDQEYSFVCSQLLMTQLASIPIISFSALAEEQYGRPIVMKLGREDEPLVRALNECTLQIQEQHVQQLAALTKREGAAHLADTVAALRGSSPLPMVGQSYYNAVNKHFDRLAPDAEWIWQATPGREFMVFAHSLTPKK